MLLNLNDIYANPCLYAGLLVKHIILYQGSLAMPTLMGGIIPCYTNDTNPRPPNIKQFL